jgi:hypothetical protein
MLQDALDSYAMGHTADAQHKLADLTQHVTMLEQQGMITAAAAPALNGAIADLGRALANAPAPATQPPGGPPAHPGKERPLKPAKPPKLAKPNGPKHH